MQCTVNFMKPCPLWNTDICRVISVKFKEVPQITDDDALRNTSEAPSSSIIFERRRTSVQLMSPKLSNSFQNNLRKICICAFKNGDFGERRFEHVQYAIRVVFWVHPFTVV